MRLPDSYLVVFLLLLYRINSFNPTMKYFQ
nr:MAG TPA: amyloid precursor [Caudoviricetes sp.]